MRLRRAVAGIAALCALASCTSPGRSPDPAPSGDPLPPIATDDCPAPDELLTQAEAAAAPGPRLPDVTLDCIGSDRTVALARLGGAPAVLNVWASWCQPCRKEMPALQSVYPAARERGVRFLGVNVNDRTELAARRTIQDTGVAYPSVRAPGRRVLNLLRVPGPPVTLFVDARGTVVHRAVGELDAAELRVLIAEHLDVDVGPPA